jgi:hypothetical protein
VIADSLQQWRSCASESLHSPELQGGDNFELDS